MDIPPKKERKKNMSITIHKPHKIKTSRITIVGKAKKFYIQTKIQVGIDIVFVSQQPNKLKIL